MFRIRKILRYYFILFLFLVCSISYGAVIGPSNGSLVIVGGGSDISECLAKFIELAGGNDAAIVVIPTAGGADHYDSSFYGLKLFQKIGATNITLLHTYSPDTANTEKFVKPIKKAKGVWFSGGRQWRLADAYLNTLVNKELLALLERGGVIGGTSAGATIQGSYLVRGDTKTNTIMMGDHQEGFGFLHNVAIDQHLLKRNRQFDLIEVIEAHPDLLGIGIDENTAIMVKNDKFEVIGKGYVAIYDHNRMIPPNGKFYFLSANDQYNLITREAFRSKTQPKPLDRVEEEEWHASE